MLPTNRNITYLKDSRKKYFFFLIFPTVDRPEVALNQDFKPSQLQGRVGRKECIMKKSGSAE